MKKITMFLLFVAFLVITLSPVANTRAASKTVYWSLYTSKPKLYYSGKYLYLKGKWAKGSSEARAQSAKKKSISKKYKISSSCRIYEIEDTTKTYKFKTYIKGRGVKRKQNFSSIDNTVIIKNGKVTAIYFSA